MPKTVCYNRVQLIIFRFLIKILLCVCISSGLYSYSVAQNALKEGEKWYQQRSVKADSFRAKPKYINNAIQALKKALDKGINPEETTEYLLRSYYFKGTFLGLNEQKQKQVFDKGKKLGKRMLKRYPDSVPIKFWYAANTGRWANQKGLVAAATNGTAKKLRSIGEDIVNLDPDYEGGGGYRLLAQVYFYSPNIPLVMTWPSDKKALKLVKKAMNIESDNPANLLLYARILLKLNRKKEAETYLNKLLQIQPDPPNLVEDRYVRYKARKLLKDNFG